MCEILILTVTLASASYKARMARSTNKTLDKYFTDSTNKSSVEKTESSVGGTRIMKLRKEVAPV